MICRFTRWLAWRFCPEMIWNRDMSLENDHLRTENDALRDRLREFEDDQQKHRDKPETNERKI